MDEDLDMQRLSKFMSHQTCSKTVTARIARTEFLTAQLQNTALFVLQLIRNILAQVCEVQTCPVPTELGAWRQLIVTVRSDLEMYNIFYNKTSDRFPALADTIRLAADAHMALIGLEKMYQPFVDPIHDLWLYVMRLAYIKPFLVMDDDDTYGHAVETVSSSFQHFIAMIVTLDIPRDDRYLNADALADLTLHDDDENETVPPPPPSFQDHKSAAADPLVRFKKLATRKTMLPTLQIRV